MPWRTIAVLRELCVQEGRSEPRDKWGRIRLRSCKVCKSKMLSQGMRHMPAGSQQQLWVSIQTQGLSKKKAANQQRREVDV